MKICTKCKIEKEYLDFDHRKESSDGYQSQCIECRKENCRDFYKRNKDKQIERMSLYQAKNKEHLKEYRKQRHSTPEYKEKARNYKKERIKNDPLYKLACSVRRSISMLFRGRKSQKTKELIGCSFEELKRHFESLFQPGMTWDNYGEWHIDHRFPLSKAENREHLEKLCHFTNLQPLWALDNLSKGNRLDYTQSLLTSSKH